MHNAIASGTILFGLLSIPFKLFVATSPASVSFNLLHAKCGSRLKTQHVCPSDNEVVPAEHRARGYEYSKGRFVRFTDKELAALDSARADELELLEFVPQSALDPTLVEKSYYVRPGDGGGRAFDVLAEAMRRTKRVAIGRYFARGKEQRVALRASARGLVLHYLFWADELRKEDPGVGFVAKPELELAMKLVKKHAKSSITAVSYENPYPTRLKLAVERKVAGGQGFVEPSAPAETKARILDVVEGLSRSLEATKETRKRRHAIT
jgi:DNA end-binding protein Ku